jgi:2-dehydropantoate 2-reductase
VAALSRICVVGAGTIGSLFAAHLARVADVSVLTRREEHARALNARGLRVSGRAEFSSRVRAATDPAALAADLVIVACKGNDLEAAAERLSGNFAGAIVMTTQNGLGAEEVVARHGDWPLLSSVTFMSGTKHDDTHVEYILDTATWIGPYRGTTLDDAVSVAGLVARSGLHARAFPDLRPAQWSKLIFNATVNGVAALTGLPHDRRFAEPPLGELVRALIDEGKRVAPAWADDPWQMNVLATERGHAHRPSMLEDVEARRPTEIELINGSLVRAARTRGEHVPLQEALYALVKGKEASYA